MERNVEKEGDLSFIFAGVHLKERKVVLLGIVHLLWRLHLSVLPTAARRERLVGLDVLW